MIRIARATAVILFSLGYASTLRAEPSCYDAKVLARVTDQVPSDIPDCGKDCIIMSRPWFVDLDVAEVIDGAGPANEVRILTFQHTYQIPSKQLWLLRKNEIGGYNGAPSNDEVAAVRCPARASPVAPYLRPGHGRSLDDARDAGIRAFGHHPS